MHCAISRFAAIQNTARNVGSLAGSSIMTNPSRKAGEPS